MRRRIFLALLALAGARQVLAAEAGADADQLWRRLQAGGHVVLMRHAATVPGIGDPPGFQLAQCGTQRNLSEAGKADARRLGAAFRQHQVPVAEVLSSRWCRCLDTAQLAFGRARPEPMVDSMFDDDAGARAAKLGALRRYLGGDRPAGNLVLVTHDVNIRALVDIYVAQGEMVVAEVRPDGSLRALGKLALPAAG